MSRCNVSSELLTLPSSDWLLVNPTQGRNQVRAISDHCGRSSPLSTRGQLRNKHASCFNSNTGRAAVKATSSHSDGACAIPVHAHFKPVFSTLSPCTQTISKLWSHLDSIPAVGDLKKWCEWKGGAGAESVCVGRRQNRREKQSYEIAGSWRGSKGCYFK